MAATSLGVAGARARVAEARDLTALEHQQQLPLQLEIQVRDLVEEQRAAVGLLEHARVILDRARVGAAARAEQVRRQQRRRHRRQIRDHQRPLRARARVDHLLGEEALARPGLPLDQHRQRRAGQHLELPPQLGHRRIAPPEDRPLLDAVVQRQRARDLGREAAAVDHLVLAQVDQRIGGAIGAQLGVGGRQHDDRERRVARAQPLEDEQPLPAPQPLDRRPPRLRLGRQARLVLGQEALLGQREVQIEDDQIGQRRQARQRLRRLGEVVRAAQRAAARPLLAHLAGDAPVAARDRVELGELAMHHVDGLVAIVDDEQARH